MYFNLAEGYVTTWVLTPKIFLQNPITTKLLYKYQKKTPLTSNDFHDFKVNEIIFPQSEYVHLQQVLSKLDIVPANIEGILVYKINNT